MPMISYTRNQILKLNAYSGWLGAQLPGKGAVWGVIKDASFSSLDFKSEQMMGLNREGLHVKVCQKRVGGDIPWL